jgi:hypothetical protein
LFVEDGSVRVSSFLTGPFRYRSELSVGIRETVTDQDGFERDRDGRGSRFVLVEVVNDGSDVGDIGTGVRLSRDVERYVLELGELFVEELHAETKRRESALARAVASA